MHSFPVGIAVLTSDDSQKMLFCNSSLKRLLSSAHPTSNESSRLQLSLELGTQENLFGGASTMLKELPIRVVVKGSSQTVSLISFASFFIKADNSESFSYFADIKDQLIEVRGSDITFESEKAKIISFFDCSAAQRLEQAQAENKYKTTLIATISHELRTPVNAINGSLDLISPYVPFESSKLVKIAKDSCKMIVFHINDLTVFSSIDWVRIMGN